MPIVLEVTCFINSKDYNKLVLECRTATGVYRENTVDILKTYVQIILPLCSEMPFSLFKDKIEELVPICTNSFSLQEEEIKVVFMFDLLDCWD
jgi:hypothetical protein